VKVKEFRLSLEEENSYYYSTYLKYCKPFNPLYGSTYMLSGLAKKMISPGGYILYNDISTILLI